MDQRTGRSLSAQQTSEKPDASEQTSERWHARLGYALALLVLIDLALLLLLIVLLAGSAQPIKTIGIIAAVLALMLSGPLLMVSLQEGAGPRAWIRSAGRNKLARNVILGVTAALILVFLGALLAGFPVDSPKLTSMRAAIFERPAVAGLPTDKSTSATPTVTQQPAGVTEPFVASLVLVSPISTAASTATSVAAVSTSESAPVSAPTLAPTTLPPPTATAVPPTATPAPTATATATSSPTATLQATSTKAAVTPSPTVSAEQAQALVRDAMNAANGALIAWLKDVTQSTDSLEAYYCGAPAWKSVSAFVTMMAARPGDAITAHYTATDLSTATQETDNRWRLQQTETWTYAGQGWELKGQAETYAYWVIEKPGAAQRFCIDEYKLVKP